MTEQTEGAEVETLAEVLGDIRVAEARRADWWTDDIEHSLLIRVLRGECVPWAAGLLASDWLAAREAAAEARGAQAVLAAGGGATAALGSSLPCRPRTGGPARRCPCRCCRRWWGRVMTLDIEGVLAGHEDWDYGGPGIVECEGCGWKSERLGPEWNGRRGDRHRAHVAAVLREQIAAWLGSEAEAADSSDDLGRQYVSGTLCSLAALVAPSRVPGEET